MNLLAVLTYAVEQLKVKHILVTGHYDCGGIRAAVKTRGFGQVLDAWLQVSSYLDFFLYKERALGSARQMHSLEQKLAPLCFVTYCPPLDNTPRTFEMFIVCTKRNWMPLRMTKHGIDDWWN